MTESVGLVCTPKKIPAAVILLAVGETPLAVISLTLPFDDSPLLSGAIPAFAPIPDVPVPAVVPSLPQQDVSERSGKACPLMSF